MRIRDDDKEKPRKPIQVQDNPLEEAVTCVVQRALVTAVAEDVVDSILEEATLLVCRLDEVQSSTSEKRRLSGAESESNPDVTTVPPNQILQDCMLVGDNFGVRLDQLRRLFADTNAPRSLLQGEVKRRINEISGIHGQHRRLEVEVGRTMEGQDNTEGSVQENTSRTTKVHPLQSYLKDNVSTISNSDLFASSQVVSSVESINTAIDIPPLSVTPASESEQLSLSHHDEQHVQGAQLPIADAGNSMDETINNLPKPSKVIEDEIHSQEHVGTDSTAGVDTCVTDPVELIEEDSSINCLVSQKFNHIHEDNPVQLPLSHHDEQNIHEFQLSVTDSGSNMEGTINNLGLKQPKAIDEMISSQDPKIISRREEERMRDESTTVDSTTNSALDTSGTNPGEHIEEELSITCIKSQLSKYIHGDDTVQSSDITSHNEEDVYTNPISVSNASILGSDDIEKNRNNLFQTYTQDFKEQNITQSIDISSQIVEDLVRFVTTSKNTDSMTEDMEHIEEPLSKNSPVLQLCKYVNNDNTVQSSDITSHHVEDYMCTDPITESKSIEGTINPSCSTNTEQKVESNVAKTTNINSPNVEDVEEHPANVEDVEHPANVEDVDEHPANVADVQEHPANVEDVEHPANVEDVDETPANVDDVQEHPANVEDVEHPANVEDVEHPANVEDVDEHPANVEDVEHPANVEDVEHPANVEDVDEHPVNVEDVDEHPANVEDVDEHPVNVEEVEHPANVEDVYEHPANVEDVDEHPSNVEDVDEHPANVEDVEEYPSNVKATSHNKNPVIEQVKRIQQPVLISGMIPQDFNDLTEDNIVQSSYITSQQVEANMCIRPTLVCDIVTLENKVNVGVTFELVLKDSKDNTEINAIQSSHINSQDIEEHLVSATPISNNENSTTEQDQQNEGTLLINRVLPRKPKDRKENNISNQSDVVPEQVEDIISTKPTPVCDVMEDEYISEGIMRKVKQINGTQSSNITSHDVEENLACATSNYSSEASITKQGEQVEGLLLINDFPAQELKDTNEDNITKSIDTTLQRVEEYMCTNSSPVCDISTDESPDHLEEGIRKFFPKHPNNKSHRNATQHSNINSPGEKHLISEPPVSDTEDSVVELDGHIERSVMINDHESQESNTILGDNIIHSSDITPQLVEEHKCDKLTPACDVSTREYHDQLQGKISELLPKYTKDKNETNITLVSNSNSEDIEDHLASTRFISDPSASIIENDEHVEDSFLNTELIPHESNIMKSSDVLLQCVKEDICTEPTSENTVAILQKQYNITVIVKELCPIDNRDKIETNVTQPSDINSVDLECRSVCSRPSFDSKTSTNVQDEHLEAPMLIKELVTPELIDKRGDNIVKSSHITSQNLQQDVCTRLTSMCNMSMKEDQDNVDGTISDVFPQYIKDTIETNDTQPSKMHYQSKVHVDEHLACASPISDSMTSIIKQGEHNEEPLLMNHLVQQKSGDMNEDNVVQSSDINSQHVEDDRYSKPIPSCDISTLENQTTFIETIREEVPRYDKDSTEINANQYSNMDSEDVEDHLVSSASISVTENSIIEQDGHNEESLSSNEYVAKESIAVNEDNIVHSSEITSQHLEEDMSSKPTPVCQIPTVDNFTGIIGQGVPKYDKDSAEINATQYSNMDSEDVEDHQVSSGSISVTDTSIIEESEHNEQSLLINEYVATESNGVNEDNIAQSSEITSQHLEEYLSSKPTPVCEISSVADQDNFKEVVSVVFSKCGEKSTVINVTQYSNINCMIVADHLVTNITQSSNNDSESIEGDLECTSSVLESSTIEQDGHIDGQSFNNNFLPQESRDKDKNNVVQSSDMTLQRTEDDKCVKLRNVCSTSLIENQNNFEEKTNDLLPKFNQYNNETNITQSSNNDSENIECDVECTSSVPESSTIEYGEHTQGHLITDGSLPQESEGINEDDVVQSSYITSQRTEEDISIKPSHVCDISTIENQYNVEERKNKLLPKCAEVSNEINVTQSSNIDYDNIKDYLVCTRSCPGSSVTEGGETMQEALFSNILPAESRVINEDEVSESSDVTSQHPENDVNANPTPIYDTSPLRHGDNVDKRKHGLFLTYSEGMGEENIATSSNRTCEDGDDHLKCDICTSESDVSVTELGEYITGPMSINDLLSMDFQDNSNHDIVSSSEKTLDSDDKDVCSTPTPMCHIEIVENEQNTQVIVDGLFPTRSSEDNISLSLNMLYQDSEDHVPFFSSTTDVESSNTEQKHPIEESMVNNSFLLPKKSQDLNEDNIMRYVDITPEHTCATPTPSFETLIADETEEITNCLLSTHHKHMNEYNATQSPEVISQNYETNIVHDTFTTEISASSRTPEQHSERPVFMNSVEPNESKYMNEEDGINVARITSRNAEEQSIYNKDDNVRQPCETMYQHVTKHAFDESTSERLSIPKHEDDDEILSWINGSLVSTDTSVVKEDDKNSPPFSNSISQSDGEMITRSSDLVSVAGNNVEDTTMNNNLVPEREQVAEPSKPIYPAMVTTSSEPFDQILIDNFDQNIARDSVIFLDLDPSNEDTTPVPYDPTVIRNYSSIYGGEYVRHLGAHEMEQAYKKSEGTQQESIAMKVESESAPSHIAVFVATLDITNRTIRPTHSLESIDLNDGDHQETMNEINQDEGLNEEDASESVPDLLEELCSHAPNEGRVSTVSVGTHVESNDMQSHHRDQQEEASGGTNELMSNSEQTGKYDENHSQPASIDTNQISTEKCLQESQDDLKTHHEEQPHQEENHIHSNELSKHTITFDNSQSASIEMNRISSEENRQNSESDLQNHHEQQSLHDESSSGWNELFKHTGAFDLSKSASLEVNDMSTEELLQESQDDLKKHHEQQPLQGENNNNLNELSNHTSTFDNSQSASIEMNRISDEENLHNSLSDLKDHHEQQLPHDENSECLNELSKPISASVALEKNYITPEKILQQLQCELKKHHEQQPLHDENSSGLNELSKHISTSASLEKNQISTEESLTELQIDLKEHHEQKPLHDENSNSLSKLCNQTSAFKHSHSSSLEINHISTEKLLQVSHGDLKEHHEQQPLRDESSHDLNVNDMSIQTSAFGNSQSESLEMYRICTEQRLQHSQSDLKNHHEQQPLHDESVNVLNDLSKHSSAFDHSQSASLEVNEISTEKLLQESQDDLKEHHEQQPLHDENSNVWNELSNSTSTFDNSQSTSLDMNHTNTKERLQKTPSDLKEHHEQQPLQDKNSNNLKELSKEICAPDNSQSTSLEKSHISTEEHLKESEVGLKIHQEEQPFDGADINYLKESSEQAEHFEKDPSQFAPFNINHRSAEGAVQKSQNDLKEHLEEEEFHHAHINVYDDNYDHTGESLGSSQRGSLTVTHNSTEESPQTSEDDVGELSDQESEYCINDLEVREADEFDEDYTKSIPSNISNGVTEGSLQDDLEENLAYEDNNDSVENYEDTCEFDGDYSVDSPQEEYDQTDLYDYDGNEQQASSESIDQQELYNYDGYSQDELQTTDASDTPQVNSTKTGEWEDTDSRSRTYSNLNSDVQAPENSSKPDCLVETLSESAINNEGPLSDMSSSTSDVTLVSSIATPNSCEQNKTLLNNEPAIDEFGQKALVNGTVLDKTQRQSSVIVDNVEYPNSNADKCCGDIQTECVVDTVLESTGVTETMTDNKETLTEDSSAQNNRDTIHKPLPESGTAETIECVSRATGKNSSSSIDVDTLPKPPQTEPMCSIAKININIAHELQLDLPKTVSQNIDEGETIKQRSCQKSTILNSIGDSCAENNIDEGDSVSVENLRVVNEMSDDNSEEKQWPSDLSDDSTYVTMSDPKSTDTLCKCDELEMSGDDNFEKLKFYSAEGLQDDTVQYSKSEHDTPTPTSHVGNEGINEVPLATGVFTYDGYEMGDQTDSTALLDRMAFIQKSLVEALANQPDSATTSDLYDLFDDSLFRVTDALRPTHILEVDDFPDQTWYDESENPESCPDPENVGNKSKTCRAENNLLGSSSLDKQVLSQEPFCFDANEKREAINNDVPFNDESLLCPSSLSGELQEDRLSIDMMFDDVESLCAYFTNTESEHGELAHDHAFSTRVQPNGKEDSLSIHSTIETRSHISPLDASTLLVYSPSAPSAIGEQNYVHPLSNINSDDVSILEVESFITLSKSEDQSIIKIASRNVSSCDMSNSKISPSRTHDVNSIERSLDHLFIDYPSDDKISMKVHYPRTHSDNAERLSLDSTITLDDKTLSKEYAQSKLPYSNSSAVGYDAFDIDEYCAIKPHEYQEARREGEVRHKDTNDKGGAFEVVQTRPIKVDHPQLTNGERFSPNLYYSLVGKVEERLDEVSPSRPGFDAPGEANLEVSRLNATVVNPEKECMCKGIDTEKDVTDSPSDTVHIQPGFFSMFCRAKISRQQQSTLQESGENVFEPRDKPCCSACSRPEEEGTILNGPLDDDNKNKGKRKWNLKKKMRKFFRHLTKSRKESQSKLEKQDQGD